MKAHELKEYHYMSCKWTFQDLFSSKEWPNFQKAWKTRVKEKSLGLWSQGGPLHGHLIAAAIVCPGPPGLDGHAAGLQLKYLFVHGNYQGRGLGTRLLGEICSDSMVVVPAKGLESFYMKRGFTVTDNKFVYSNKNVPSRSS